MSRDRASIFGDEDDLDVSAFAPKGEEARKAIAPETMRAVADASKFPSREPVRAAQQDQKPAAPKHQPRRYRTGRTIQFNARTTQNTYDALYAIADAKGWKIAETLEHALAALQRELATTDPQL